MNTSDKLLVIEQRAFKRSCLVSGNLAANITDPKQKARR